MSSGFKFDKRAFERDIKKAVTKGIKTKAIPEIQAKFESVYETHRGRPADEVAERLLELMPGEPGNRNSAQDFAGHAQAISAGRRILVELDEPIKW